MKNLKGTERGITLVALVITIIIIIILATVTISFIFGDNGLIRRAQQAKLEQEIATARETLTMILGDAFAEKKINPEYDQNEFLDKFIEAREPNVYLEEDEIGLDGHVFDLDRSVPELGKYQGELTGPRIKEIKVLEETTNSASIEVITANAEGATYEYWYKNDTEGQEQWKKVETDDKSNTCTIEGLIQGEIYNIRVVVTTNDGSATGEINVYLGEIPEGTITFTPAKWAGDGTATTTINTSETGYTLQYQIVVGDGAIVNTAWQPATSGQTIEGLHHNETVYGRLWDGTNESKEYASVRIKDGQVPQGTIIQLGENNTTTTGSVTATVVLKDNESGVNVGESRWVYNQTPGNIGTNEGNYTNAFTGTNTTQQITLTATQPGTYYLHVLTKDNAGKLAETISEGVAVSQLATSISVNPTSISLTNGQTYQLSATVNPGDTSNKVVTWSSNNPGIASVNSSTGLVTAVSPGNATITASTTDGSGIQATCSVTVIRTIESTLKAGNYVYYVDSTRTTRKCIVLYGAEDINFGIQIITEGIVGTVQLGNGTTVSSASEDFNKAATSYNNAINILNTKAMDYLNTMYATDARCVGSVPNNKNSESEFFVGKYDYLITYNGKMRDGDTNSDSDGNRMYNLGITTIPNTSYWVASRGIYSDENTTDFNMRYIDVNGITLTMPLCSVYGSGRISSSNYSYGLRPVFHLKPGIKVTGGDGSSGNPYTLGV